LTAEIHFLSEEIPMAKTQKATSTKQLIVNVSTTVNAELDKKGLSVPKRVVQDIIQGFLGHVESELTNGHKIRLDGVGVLQVKNRAARMGRNPQTGEEIKIPASKKIAFRAAKSLKERVGGSSSKGASKKKRK
jgi:DNA-binding protein HU-beta